MTRPTLTTLEPRETPAWTPLATTGQYLVVGPGEGYAPTVRVLDAGTGQVVNSFAAYAAGFTAGVQVALGDVTGDGIPDIVTAPRNGGGPNLRVYSGADGSLVVNFFAYESSFRGGASVAAADLDGDGRAELIVGAGVGGGPRVRVFRAADLTPLRDFFAYESTFRGGVNVAAGDFGGRTGKGIVAGAGVGGGPAVKVFRYADLTLTAAFFAFDPAVRGGVFVAAGDLDGDSRADVVAGAGSGAGGVKVYDPDADKIKLDALLAGGFDGARVGVTNGADAKLLVGGMGQVRLYRGLDVVKAALELGGDGGVFVG